MQARILGLWRYPVKSCAGEAVAELSLGADGTVAGDREWVVVDGQGTLTWMGAVPTLARVSARLGPQGCELRCAGQAPLRLHGDSAQPCELRAWNEARASFDLLPGGDMGADAAAWLVRATGQAGLRLVRLTQAARRRAGVNALHLVGQASVEVWRHMIPAPFDQAVLRLRPNVLIGLDEPDAAFLEDHALELESPQARLRVIQQCVRCIVPGLEPGSGAENPSCLAALSALSQSRQPGAPVSFGIYAEALGAGRLLVGEPLHLRLNF